MLENELKRPITYYNKWRFWNTTVLIISWLLLYYYRDSDIIKMFISYLHGLGYFGAILGGILFVSIFTVVPATLALASMVSNQSVVSIAIFAGLGAVIGDYIIFRFLKDRVVDEIRPLQKYFGGKYMRSLIHTPYFTWTAPVIGLIIIASPFPDEVGIGLLSTSKLTNGYFVLLAYILNAGGILAILLLST